jgi:hypothetical protein
MSPSQPNVTKPQKTNNVAETVSPSRVAEKAGPKNFDSLQENPKADSPPRESGAKKTKTKESEILKLYKSFQTNLDSLKIFVDTLSPVASEKDSNQIASIKKLLNDAVDQLKGLEKKRESEEDDDKVNKNEVDSILKQFRNLPKVNPAHKKLLHQSSFVLLVGYFEYLFADLLKFYYRNFPGNISDKPIHIIINELKAYDNIDEAVDYVISKEVEAILFDLSFNELIDFFDKKLKINLERSIINWDIINETRERRHIIVHNNSIINKKYLLKSKIDNLPDKANLINDQKINVSTEYFQIAYNEIYLAGHILIFNCWNQWAKNNSEEMFSEILNTTFDCLNSNLDYVSKKLSFHSLTFEPETDAEADLSLRTKFNYILALKRLKENDEFEKEIKKIKISSLSPLFKLAYYTLKEDKEKIIENIRHCKLIDDMKAEWLHEWPIFAQVKNDPEFLKILEKEFE